MKIIADYVDRIDNELADAKDYAEKYLYYKSLGNSRNANYYKDMSNDELTHAMYNHEMAVDEVKRIETVFTPPATMQEAWDKSHVRYVETYAWVKKMLEM